MSKIIKVDTNGVKPLLDMRELGYDNYPAGGDVGRVYVGTGTANIPLAKKVEVTAVDTKADTHIGRVDNPHSVTKAQVGLWNVDNTSDASKPISTATQAALNTKVDTTGDQTIAGVKTFSSSPIIPTPTDGTQATNKDYADTKVAKVTSIDNTIVRFNGTTGEVQNSLIALDDAGRITKSGDFTLHNSDLDSASTSGETVLNLSYDTSSNGSKIKSKKISANTTNLEFYVGYGYGTNVHVATLNPLGDLILTSGTGALGYGTGAGGTVTQLTNKYTAVTLNKPSGKITMNNDALAAGASVFFAVNNSLVTISDHIVLTMGGSTTNTNYIVFPTFSISSGMFYIMVKNISAGSLSEALEINFSIIKGAIA